MVDKAKVGADLRKRAIDALVPGVHVDFRKLGSRQGLVRLHGNFVQFLAIGVGRYGESIRVWPTFYVLGTCPWDEVIPQAVALGLEDPNRWRFAPSVLEADFGDRVCSLLNSESPIPFAKAIDDNSVISALEFFAKQDKTESAALYLSFFLMSMRLPGSQAWLMRARKRFQKNNHPLQHDWQHATLRRIDELESRISVPAGYVLCRQDAQEHATRLKLPTLIWP